jgi:hypothetical protein
MLIKRQLDGKNQFATIPSILLTVRLLPWNLSLETGTLKRSRQDKMTVEDGGARYSENL